MNQKLIGIILAVIILGLGGWKLYEYKNPSPVKKVSILQEPPKPIENAGKIPETKAESINIALPTPVNGVLKGVIEIGATGFNSFVIDIDKNRNWELIDKQFGKSLAYEGFITKDDVWNTMKNYISSMGEKGVQSRNIHFVVSSGALKNPKTDLIIKSIEAQGFIANRVTAEQEGKLAFKSAMPKEYKLNSFVVDMGSGNTKISWYENNQIKTIELPGAKYYEKGITDDVVYNQVKEACNKIPASLRQTCFIIGGIPYELSNKQGRFSQLGLPSDYSDGGNAKMKCGLNIYEAIAESTECDDFIFDANTNFTIGYLISL
jgi:hypothetical protein